MLQLIPRSPIEAFAKVHGTGRRSRGLSRWSQFGALVFAPFGGTPPPAGRGLLAGCPSSRPRPPGLRPPQRSTLAAAHERRLAALYQELLTTLCIRCRTVAPTHRFRFKSPLFPLDRTTISLGLSLFPQARFRTTTGAMKVPTLLDHAGHIPAVVVVTEGKRHDLAVARGLHVTARVAVDRATRVTADHEVVLSGPKGLAYPARLRQVRYRGAATGKRAVFWTKALHWAAPTIAAIGQPRWQVALFLKAIKQNLGIKTFLGTCENAVMTQVWVALITDLILAFLRFKAGLGISFQQLVRLLQIHLFERRNLIELCSPPPPHVSGTQLLWAV